MKLGQLRNIIRTMLVEKHPGMVRSEMYSHIQFDPKNVSFTDRWDRPIPGPQSMELRALRDWIESNRVETIEVRGKRFSPRSFLARIAQAHQPPEGNAIPIVKGEPVHENASKFIDALHQLVNEELWKVGPPKRLRDTLPDLEIDAPSKREAVRKAADEYFMKHGARGIDPFSLEIEEKLAESDDGFAVVFIVPTDSTESKNAKAKGYRVISSSRGDVIYHPKHWSVGMPGDPGNSNGIIISPTSNKGLVPETEDAYSVITNAYRNVDHYKYPENIDVNEFQETWEHSYKTSDDYDKSFSDIVKEIIS